MKHEHAHGSPWRFERPSRAALLAASKVLSIGILLAACIQLALPESKRESALRDGPRIVEGLEGYESEHGTYPYELESVLEDLVSPLRADLEWEYERLDEGSHFSLTAGDGYGLGWEVSYRSWIGAWEEFD